MKENFKTNAMRILEANKICYTPHHYSDDTKTFQSGADVAKKIGADEKTVFKTLVTKGSDNQYYVFVIPVCEELNLKACAKSVGVKSVEMIKVSEITKVTGYIRGGCSPIGMKKEYRTVVDSSALLLDTMYVSAGKIGFQVSLSPSDLKSVSNCTFEEITL